MEADGAGDAVGGSEVVGTEQFHLIRRWAVLQGYLRGTIAL